MSSSGEDSSDTLPDLGRATLASALESRRPTVPASSTNVGSRPTELATGTVLSGRYRLLSRLGAGGMGEVWEAEHLALAHTVAIKCVRNDEGDPQMAARLRLEAELVARLEHTNVVSVSDSGEDPHGRPYIVMERLRGQTLSQLLRDRGALAWTQAKNVAAQIAAGLACAHGAGIVHRDLKPSNVFVLEEPHGQLPIKIIDFGLAKATAVAPGDRALTRSGTIFGTPTYMPPEQVRGEPLDGRADLYALGAILYEMLTGHPPWVRDSHVELLYCQLFEPPPSPRALAPEVPEDLDAIVLRCLCKDRALRFADADALRAALVGAGTGKGATFVPEEVLPQPSPELRKRYGSMVPVLVVPSGLDAPPRPSRVPITALAVVAVAVVGALGLAWASGLLDRFTDRATSTSEPAAVESEPPSLESPPAAVMQPEPSPVPAVIDDTPPPAMIEMIEPVETIEAVEPSAEPAEKRADSPRPTTKPRPAKPSDKPVAPAADPGAATPPPEEKPPEPPEPPKPTGPVKHGDIYDPFPDLPRPAPKD